MAKSKRRVRDGDARAPAPAPVPVPEPVPVPVPAPEPEPEPEPAPEPAPEPLPAALHQQIGKLKAQLETAETEREDIQEQYEELLDKVAHIKTTLGQRLKSDAAELARVKEELAASQKAAADRDAEIAALAAANKELLSKYDKDHAQIGYLELQLGEEQAKSAALDAKVAQISQDMHQQTSYAEHYRKTHLELASSTKKKEEELVAKLEATKADLADSRLTLEGSQAETLELRHHNQRLSQQLAEHASRAQSAESLEETIREKNILVGKLRHEAVILNEHLTNALRIVKKDSEGQTVDKELISNLVLQFVQIPRGDTKKFEVLQLIASCLDWDEGRRIEAGISRSSQGGERSLGGFLGKFAEFMERESRKG